MRPPGNTWLDRNDVIRLVRDAPRAEPRALATLLATLRPVFLQFFARRLRSDGAEDLAQVALIRVARALERIDPEHAADFVVTVAENRLRSERRRCAREAQRFTRIELAQAVPALDAPDQEAEAHELARAIQQTCRTTLPPELREIVRGLLRGLSQSEIAARQQVPAATIRTRIRRARALLRVELARYREPKSPPR